MLRAVLELGKLLFKAVIMQSHASPIKSNKNNFVSVQIKMNSYIVTAKIYLKVYFVIPKWNLVSNLTILCKDLWSKLFIVQFLTSPN